jgi:hypothetical protein
MRIGRQGGGRRAVGRRDVVVGLLLAVVLFGATGCRLQRFGDWGHAASYQGFDPGSLNRGGGADFTVLVPLTQVFYERINNRRFNSKATYDDPALREFFKSLDAFSDYYAGLSEALDRAHFESLRPTAVRLDEMRRTRANHVQVSVTFQGENGLPLRWWTTRTHRTDLWEFIEGRWWIVPGKL